MWQTVLSAGVVVVLLALGGGCASPTANTHQGKVVEAGSGKLTMTDRAGGNQHSHDVAADAALTCGGQTCTLTDLKAGFTITVTVEQRGGQTLVTKVEAVEAKS